MSDHQYVSDRGWHHHFEAGPTGVVVVCRYCGQRAPWRGRDRRVSAFYGYSAAELAAEIQRRLGPTSGGQ